MKFPPYLLILLSIFYLSCTSSSDDSTDDILTYIEANKLTITDTLSGVLVCVINEGSLEKPKIDSTKSVTFTVVGEYLDGTIFDNNTSVNPATINMSALLEGLRIGMTKFGRSGSGTIIVPPGLGFGGNPPRGIRPNATLAFKIQLLDFK
ncbi:MAG TPA: FKBP-type peptidyl-prolyl cis-trans isomerase [Saprospiraceae bacterium]|nr:FKBP-type peptidyl-prolyl cis-trans isomerase [Saprospiraceae bacterium]